MIAQKKMYGVLSAILIAVSACSSTPVPAPSTGVGSQSPITAQGINSSYGQLLNADRARAGLSPVSANGLLEQIAAGHATDMEQQNFFSHTSSDGRNLGQRARGAGYGYCFVAENIARGQPNVDVVHQSWMTSAGHRANNLARDATEYGLAKVDDTWVLVLASPGC